MWKGIVERGRPQMAIGRMRTACWIPKATNTHSEYVTLIAFPQQQWLQEHASVLRYMYIFLYCSSQLFAVFRYSSSCTTTPPSIQILQGQKRLSFCPLRCVQ